MQDKRPFTFSNGVAITYTKLTPYFLGKFNRLAQRHLRASQPTPPVVETDLGTVVNTQDTTYQAELNEWWSRVGYTMFGFAVQQGVEVPRDALMQAKAIVQERMTAFQAEQATFADFARIHGYDNDVSDFEKFASVPVDDEKYRYLLFVGADGSHVDDLVRLMDAMRGANDPADPRDTEREADVVAAIESFPDNATREGYLEVSPA